MPTWNGTRAELTRSLQLLPAVLRGEYVDPLAARLRELFWGYVANEMLELIQFSYMDKLNHRGGYDGIAWQELSRYTIKHKTTPRTGRKTDILIKTGALYDSLEPGQDGQPSNAPNQVNDLIPGGLLLGSKDPKADAHQHGDDSTNLPARPFIPDDIPFQWESHLEIAMERAMEKVIEELVAQGGFS